MTQEITAITLMDVNCYLVKTGERFVLIDTGFSFRRGALVKSLRKYGCQPGNLELIVITHGDIDHTGNCAYLQKMFGAKIALHREESGAVSTGNMVLNRQNPLSWFSQVLLRFAGLVMFTRFKPALYIGEGDRLSAYSLAARVLHLPGHTRGSIGILTDSGDLFCGDLLTAGAIRQYGH
jgi:hydroxyacylglutathione hydrolase